MPRKFNTGLLESLTGLVAKVSEAIEDRPHSASTRGRGADGVAFVAGLKMTHEVFNQHL